MAGQMGARALRRPGLFGRLAAWYVTGPAGHLVAGALDIGALLARAGWRRARGKPFEG